MSLVIIIIIITIIIIPFELFQPALVDGLSLESKWHHVTSDVLDSSQDSGRSQRCSSLDDLSSSSDFQLFQPLFPNLWGPFQVCQLQLVSPSSSFSSGVLVLRQDLSTCLPFIQWSTRIAVFTLHQFFLLINSRSGLLVVIRWSVFILKSQRILCISFSKTDTGLCGNQLIIRSNLNFLDNSQCITYSTQSFLVLYYLCASWQHSLILWLIVLSLPPHNVHLQLSSVFPIFVLT